MNEMLEKVATVWPEITLMIGACVCLFVGLLPWPIARRWTPVFALFSLLIAGVIVTPQVVELQPYSGPGMGQTAAAFVKLSVVVIGILLLLLMWGVPYRLKQTADELRDAEARGRFEPGNVISGEFFSFMLFSLSGVMLCAGAEDLVWLFLALELTSLPTYVMVATARDRGIAQESAVKYFFLGALSAAVFLYGFALIYGATGHTEFGAIAAEQFTADGSFSPMLLLGIAMAVIGIAFKMAAFPMHFYAADVYQGATTPVTALLAYVPKAAGAVALILVLGLVGWPLPPVIGGLLWVMAVATMTIGNVLGLLQNNVKRALGYSSVAHSGYLLIGILAGPALGGDNVIGNGLAAVLFYLLAYGAANIGAFAALSMAKGGAHGREEAETYADIANLYRNHPAIAAIMAICVFSLMGLPPMGGFIGKVYLFGSAIQNPDLVLLVVIALINAAISGVYYLRIIGACFFGTPGKFATATPAKAPMLAGLLATILAVTIGFVSSYLVAPADLLQIGDRESLYRGPLVEQPQDLPHKPDDLQKQKLSIEAQPLGDSL